MNKSLKGLFYLLIVGLAVIFSMPNFYPKDPAVSIVKKHNNAVNQKDIATIESNKNLIGYDSIEKENNGLIVKFKSIDDQMKGYSEINNLIGDEYYKNLNLVSSHPDFLDYFGAKSASLGLDLRGGVHFLMEVDTEEVFKKELLRATAVLKEKNVPFNISGDSIVSLDNEAFDRIMLNSENGFQDKFSLINEGEEYKAKLSETYKKSLQDSIVKQNIITLKNRVNEIGVAEPVVQREGSNRIIVQLPGIQDTEKAKDIIGATATLDFKAVIEKIDGSEEFDFIYSLDGKNKYAMKTKPIISGDNITDASTGFDPRTNAPLVSVELDSVGGQKMLDYTTKNKGTLMGSVLNTTTYKTIYDELGNKSKEKKLTQEAINVARIQGVFSNRFQITGLDDKNEAHKLAILLRSGSLAAPIEIIEEKTIGPNLGAENISKGKLSILIGFVLVLILMVLKYKTLGMIANICVFINMLALLAILSALGATLTLPGIAGIILTVGMAVDANVIIFERIKEEYQKKGKVKKSIENGYGKALSTVVDANITTFIAAAVLFVLGSGAIKGFAVTLLIGILTSMFTSVFLARYMTETYYKNKKEIKF